MSRSRPPARPLVPAFGLTFAATLLCFACQSPDGGTLVRNDFGTDAPSVQDTVTQEVLSGDVGFQSDATTVLECPEGTPGGFGCPCSTGSDCESSYCVQGYSEFICTQRCVDECPSGYRCVVLASTCPDCAAVCIAEISKNCAPCQVDADCIAGRCLMLSSGTAACADPCDDDNPCGDGYDCVPGDLSGDQEAFWCTPSNGTCDCTTENQGELRPCTIKSDLGLCAGEESCDPEAGWTGCTAVTPSAEVCNGFDDNCNGFADEGLPQVSECANEVVGVGACPGVAVCKGSAGVICEGPQPAPETCNGADDDCDGAADEGFLVDGVYVGDDDCGSCGAACAGTIDHAAGSACVLLAGTATCVVTSCDEGFAPSGETACAPTYEGSCDSCLEDADCPSWAQCLSVGGGSFCTVSCGAPSDGPCPPGLVCSQKPGGSESVCLLMTGGCAAEGKPCTHDWQCEDASECTSNSCTDGACSFKSISCDDQNECTSDSCNANDGCQHGPLTGASCDDDDPCTVDDVCASGACKPGAPKSCDDGLACTDDLCAAGECIAVTQANACLVGTACWGFGAKNPANPCETCSPLESQSSFVPLAAGSVCTDSDPCTSGDVCQGGQCQGGAPINCGDGNPCTADSCVPGAGCSYLPIDGPCSDGKYCTVADSCYESTCTGQKRDCSALDGICALGVCQETLEGCVREAAPAGSPCDDGQECTGGDACVGLAVCQGGAVPACCASASDCDDKNSCTVDFCDVATGTCGHDSAAADGGACDDGAWCTVDETCSGSVCKGKPRSCVGASNVCNVGVCDELSKACVANPRADGTSCSSDGNACTDDQCIAGACDHPANTEPCDDGTACTFGDVCTATVCTGQAYVCNDGVACTVDACRGDGTCTTTVQQGSCLIGGVCVASGQAKSNAPCLACIPGQANIAWSPLTNGAACSDGNDCTLIDSCQGGTCMGANPVQCPVPDQCHLAAVCDPASGACPNPAKADGSSCSDGNPCTQSDTCQGGACLGGASSCACQVTADCAKEEDGNACNGTLVCIANSCVIDPGTVVSCAPSGNVCSVTACEPSTGKCASKPVANGTSCSDGNACTQADTCQSGTCTGANPVTCSALDQCHTAGTCNPATGVCSNPDKANGTSCSDGNACTQTDTCQGGACSGANPVTCSGATQCIEAGTCNSATGACAYPNKANGTSCSDGNACTQTDTCQGGACSGASPVTCSGATQCTEAGTCNSATGACAYPNKPNGTICEDGNVCSYSDKCQSGSCGGIAYVCNYPNPDCGGNGGCYCGDQVCGPGQGCCGDYCIGAGFECY